MSSVEKKKNLTIIQKVSRAFGTFWRFIVIGFKFIFKGLDVLLNYTVGLLIRIIMKIFEVEQAKVDRSWSQIRKFVWFVIIILAIYYNNIVYNNILFDYTLKYPFKWITDAFSNGSSIYSKILNEYSVLFWDGLKTTVHLSLIGTIIGFMIAVIFSLILTLEVTRRDHFIVKFFKQTGILIVKLYVTIIRSTPMMVQAMIFYWGFRGVFNWDFLTAGLFTVSVNTAAYLTEVLRGAITNIDKGQNEAARSLGLSRSKTMFGVILPQAIKNAMPSIGNEFVINIKDTSVLSVIMVVDIFRVAEYAQSKYGQAFPPYIIAAIMYLFLTVSITIILRNVEKKLSLPKTALPSAN